MLAVEDMKIAQPETCEKYFVTKKTSSDRCVGIHLTSCVEIYTVICCCLFKQCVCIQFKKREVLIIRVFVEAEFRERRGAISQCWPAPFVKLVVYLGGHADACQTFCSFRRSLF